MEVLKKIQKIGQSQMIPTIKLYELKQDYLYVITQFKQLNTKFGSRIVVQLQEDENEFQVFLPDRFSEKLSKKEIDELNLQRLTFVYKGTQDIKGKLQVHIIDFQENKNTAESDNDSD